MKEKKQSRKFLDNEGTGEYYAHEIIIDERMKIIIEMWTISIFSFDSSPRLTVDVFSFPILLCILLSIQNIQISEFPLIPRIHTPHDTRNPNLHYNNSIVIIYSIYTGLRHSMHPIRRVWASPKD